MSVTSVKLMHDSEGSYSVKDERHYRVVWRARTSSVSDNTVDVLASSLLPRIGSVYFGWVKQANGSYLANATPKDKDSVCVFVEPKRLDDDPRTWDVTYTYEGVGSPLAVPPEIDYEDVPYQEQQVADTHGFVKTNSAIDHYEEGTDVDRNRLRIIITRAIPYSAWDPDYIETFKNTLNLNPYIHGSLTKFAPLNPDGSIPLDEFGVPVFVPLDSAPGEVKLTSITAKRMVRLQNIVPAAAKYYWQVRAVLDIDKSVFVDNNGNRQFRRWRRVLIDAGYNERILGQPKRIISANNGSASSGPTLLNGAGRRLFLPVADPLDASRMVFDQTAPELPVVQRTGTDLAAAVPEHDWYACRQGTKLTVKAPGVRANDYNADADAAVVVADVAHGALTLNSDGGFVYTSPSLIPPPPPPPPPGSPPPPPPAPPFVGWVTFTYKLVYATGESNPATACILVGPVPKVRVFEDYEYKDWTTITTIIGNW